MSPPNQMKLNSVTLHQKLTRSILGCVQVVRKSADKRGNNKSLLPTGTDLRLFMLLHRVSFFPAAAVTPTTWWRHQPKHQTVGRSSCCHEWPLTLKLQLTLTHPGLCEWWFFFRTVESYDVKPPVVTAAASWISLTLVWIKRGGLFTPLTSPCVIGTPRGCRANKHTEQTTAARGTGGKVGA